MLKLRQSTKVFIALIILGASLLISARLSGVYDVLQGKQKKITIDHRSTEHLFENAENYKKYLLNLSESDLSKLNANVDAVMEAPATNTIHCDKNTNYWVCIFEVPKTELKNTLSKLRKNTNLVSEKVFTNDQADHMINIPEHLKNEELIKKSFEKNLAVKNLTGREIANYKQELFQTQSRIDSLNNMVEMHKRNQNNILIKLVATKHNSQQGMHGNMMKKFSLYVVASVITLLILLVGGYYLVQGLLLLMSVAGIKTVRSHSRYGYYGYGRDKKKKSKRVYKDKSESSSKE